MDINYCVNRLGENAFNGDNPECSSRVYHNSLVLTTYILLLCSCFIFWFLSIFNTMNKRCIMLESELYKIKNSKSLVETELSDSDPEELTSNFIKEKEDVIKEINSRNKNDLFEELLDYVRKKNTNRIYYGKSKSDSDLIQLDKNIKTTDQPGIIGTFYSYFSS
jgi:hypothetical protein